ncbi:MAG: outer membrane lipoprotein LolB [Legionella sp.]|nr:MAG: outer membrane lipoprotein LolB [Legionella sp.]
MTLQTILGVCLALMLSSCAKLPEQHPILGATTAAASHDKSAFAASGAIAAKNQHQAWTATFYWVQNSPHDYQISIYGLMGSAAMDISVKDGVVTYHEGKKIIRARQAEDLLAKETGIRIPVNHLYYWVKGTPAPGPVEHIERSADQDIVLLKQDGFTLNYGDYRHHYPYQIRLNGHQLMVKIKIREWREK